MRIASIVDSYVSPSAHLFTLWFSFQLKLQPTSAASRTWPAPRFASFTLATVDISQTGSETVQLDERARPSVACVTSHTEDFCCFSFHSYFPVVLLLFVVFSPHSPVSASARYPARYPLVYLIVFEKRIDTCESWYWNRVRVSAPSSVSVFFCARPLPSRSLDLTCIAAQRTNQSDHRGHTLSPHPHSSPIH